MDLDQFDEARSYLEIASNEFGSDESVLKDIESAKKDIAKAEKKFEKKLKKDAEKNRAQKEESSLLN